MLKILFQLLLFVFPWRIRRFFLRKILHFEIGENAYIGFSILLARRVILGNHAIIGHLTFCKPIDLIELGEYSTIGTKNYITGFSVSNQAVLEHRHFSHIENRQCILKVGKYTDITSRHYFDCNGGIFIGDFCTIAGFETAFLSHSIDLMNNRQDAAPIKIGNYTFISTRCTLLKDSEIPSYSIVSACSLTNKKYDTEYALYGGVPCKYIKKVNDYKFFERKSGFVH